jgi:RND family efflux transporter MFP subunit
MQQDRLPRLIRSLHGLAGVPDAQLIERFVAARDEAAFELLLWRHGPMVLGVCRRVLRNEADAEDAFQATFLVLARKAASIGRREAVGGWLARVAYRVALRIRADVAKRAAGELPALSAPEPAWDDLGEVVDAEINRLPARMRAAFVLCCLEGRSAEEAARELGCAVGTVSSRLTRARERLRRALTRRGLAPEGEQLVVPVPAALVVRALRGVAGVPGALSARAVGYAEGVLRAMFLTRLKVACLFVLLAGALALGGAMAAQALDAPEAPKDEPAQAKAPAAPKNVVKPLPGGLPQRFENQCTFEAFEQQEVFAPAAGTVKDLSVALGDRVKAGKLLFRIDAPQLTFAVKEAELALRLAKAEVEEAEGKIRIAEGELKTVLDMVRGTSEPSQLVKLNAEARTKEADIARSKLALAAAKIKVEAPALALEKAKYDLSQTEVRAAFDGVVTALSCRNHQPVSGGQARGNLLVGIQRIDRVRTKLTVPRAWALRIKPGTPVKLAFDPATETNPVAATVSRIGYALRGGRQEMDVEIDIPNPNEQIRPGMFGLLDINVPGNRGALRLLSSCVSPHEERGAYNVLFGTHYGFVYIVRDGKAYRTKVSIGGYSATEVEILSGLKPTDLVLRDAEKLKSEEVPLPSGDKPEAK